MDPAKVVRTLIGFRLSCTAKGYRPIYTAMTRNSKVLLNRTGQVAVTLKREGNYSCVATSKYGTDVKEFTVIFTGKCFFSGLKEGNYLWLKPHEDHSRFYRSCYLYFSALEIALVVRLLW